MVVRARAKRMDFWNEVVAFVRENEGCPLWVLAWHFRNHYGSTVKAYRYLSALIKKMPQLSTTRDGPPFRGSLTYCSVHLLCASHEVEKQKPVVLRRHSICLESKKVQGFYG